jgi:hypothetical protein
LELFGEKNRLGRGSNLGQAGGGNLCLWGPERFFSTVRNAQYTYPLFGIARFPFFYTQITYFKPAKGQKAVITLLTGHQPIKYIISTSKFTFFGKFINIQP